MIFSFRDTVSAQKACPVLCSRTIDCSLGLNSLAMAPPELTQGWLMVQKHGDWWGAVGDGGEPWGRSGKLWGVGGSPGEVVVSCG